MIASAQSLRQMLQTFADLSSKTGKQVHTHLAQSRMQVAPVRSRDGLSPAELLDDVGLLSPDLILLDPNAPTLRPVIDGYGIVIHSGSAANVTDVMVAGEWLGKDRRPTRVDVDTVISGAQIVAENLWKRASA